MPMSPKPIIARSAPRATPLVALERGRLVAIEADAYGASAELVHQRSDFEDAATHDDEHDAALDAALRVDGLPPAARELIQRAMAADRREDTAIYDRARRRRGRAHGHARAIAGAVEHALTGRQRA